MFNKKLKQENANLRNRIAELKMLLDEAEDKAKGNSFKASVYKKECLKLRDKISEQDEALYRLQKGGNGWDMGMRLMRNRITELENNPNKEHAVEFAARLIAEGYVSLTVQDMAFTHAELYQYLEPLADEWLAERRGDRNG